MPKSKNIILFIVLTFLFSWGIEIPAALYSHGLSNLKIPRMFVQFASFSPGIVAIVLSMVTKNFKVLVRSFTKIRQPLKLYLAVIFTGTMVPFISLLLYSVIFKKPIELLPAYNLFFYILVFFFFSPFWEEIGWRGYLLPGFLEKFAPLKSSLIIGFIWAIWHIPVFFISNVNGNETSLFTFLICISCFPLSILLTTLFIRSGGSVFMCVLFHDVINSGIGYFIGNSSTNDLGVFKICVIIYFIIGIAFWTKLKKLESIGPNNLEAVRQ